MLDEREHRALFEAVATSKKEAGLRRLMAKGLLVINRLVSSPRRSRYMVNASALIFAPHPDDEVLGCGGVIALKAESGARVQVVVMTDGRASHKGMMGPDELVRIRRAEADEAATRLGLAAKYLFFGFEDHRLADHRDAACDRVVETIVRFKPDEVYVPSRRDELSDHIETNGIVRRALNRVGNPITIFEYPVWLWNRWPWTADNSRRAQGLVRGAMRAAGDVAEIVLGCRARIDVSGVLERKRAALAAYRSQVERPNGKPEWPVLLDVAKGEFLRCFDSDVEIFRRTDYRPKTSADTPRVPT